MLTEMRRPVVVLIFAGAALSLSCAGAGRGSVEARARRLESQVWSPYCAGRLLSDCTTQQADELRARIEKRLASG